MLSLSDTIIFTYKSGFFALGGLCESGSTLMTSATAVKEFVSIAGESSFATSDGKRPTDPSSL